MNTFEDEAQALVDAIFRRAKWNVLIWGPGIPGEVGSKEARDGYEKRCLMRAELQRCFPNSRFIFSEEVKIEGITDWLTTETVHADKARLIIILDITRGTHLELDYFVTHYTRWFCPKVYVFVPQEHVNTTGLVAEVFNRIPRGQIKGFTPEEFNRCDVAKHFAPDILKGLVVKEHYELSKRKRTS